MADNSVQIVIAGEIDGSLIDSTEMATAELSRFGGVAAQAGEDAANGIDASASAARSATPAFEGAADAAGALHGGLGLIGEFAPEIAGKLLEIGDHAIESAVKIDELSESLGLSSTDVQAFQFAARQSGVDTDQANAALSRFVANLGQLRETNTGPAVDALRNLGLTVDELGDDPASALSLVAQKLLAVKDPAERSRDEIALFGRAGLDVAAMLPTLAGGFDQLRQKADDAGQMLSPHIVENAKAAKIGLSDFGTWLSDTFATDVSLAMDDVAEFSRELDQIPFDKLHAPEESVMFSDEELKKADFDDQHRFMSDKARDRLWEMQRPAVPRRARRDRSRSRYRESACP